MTCDQGYWSRAIASNPSSTARACFLGGIAWFAVPFACGTMLGLTARGLSTLPDFPVLSEFDVGGGLVGVRVVTYLMCTVGSALMLLLIFLSLTSVCNFLCYMGSSDCNRRIGAERGTYRSIDTLFVRCLPTLFQSQCYKPPDCHGVALFHRLLGYLLSRHLVSILCRGNSEFFAVFGYRGDVD